VLNKKKMEAQIESTTFLGHVVPCDGIIIIIMAEMAVFTRLATSNEGDEMVCNLQLPHGD